MREMIVGMYQLVAAAAAAAAADDAGGESGFLKISSSSSTRVNACTGLRVYGRLVHSHPD